MDFKDHQGKTAKDCEQFAKELTQLAGEIRAGDMNAFERFFCEDPTNEEGLPKMNRLVEMIVFRYAVRDLERLEEDVGADNTEALNDPDTP